MLRSFVYISVKNKRVFWRSEECEDHNVNVRCDILDTCREPCLVYKVRLHCLSVFICSSIEKYKSFSNQRSECCVRKNLTMILHACTHVHQPVQNKETMLCGVAILNVTMTMWSKINKYWYGYYLKYLWSPVSWCLTCFKQYLSATHHHPSWIKNNLK